MRIKAIVHAIRKRCDRAKSTTRLGLRVSLYGQMLTSEIRTELASTHMNVDNVCELTSTRLRTDQRYLRTDRRRLRNDRWRNDRHPLNIYVHAVISCGIDHRLESVMLINTQSAQKIYLMHV